MRRDREFLEDEPFAEYGYQEMDERYPGIHDSEHRAKIDRMIERAEQVWPEVPEFEYSSEDQEIWSMVTEVLITLQDQYSCELLLEGRDELGLSTAEIPQLDEVSRRLEESADFMLAPVGGLIRPEEFLPMLANRVMRCTPYVRHPANPFFSPDPDIIHELWGHAPMFLHEEFAELSQQVGEAAASAVEAGDEELLEIIGLFYWYTIEVGLIREDGDLKIFGAATNTGIQDLLRAVDPTVEKQPLALDRIRELSIGYDTPQDIFFVADSYEQVTEMAQELAALA